MKKILFLTLIIFVMFFIFVILNNKTNLEVYKLLANEVIKEEFNYRNKKYVLTSYYKDDSTYAYNNILLKNNNKYYLLNTIEKCDMSYLINDNNIYIHCIGKRGDILRYTIDDLNTKNEILEFNYNNTPNISQIHITITKLDDQYIYLKSSVKKDNSIVDGEFVKCSLSSKICEYYK